MYSRRMNIRQPEAMFTSFLPDRQNELECALWQKLSLTFFFAFCEDGEGDHLSEGPGKQGIVGTLHVAEEETEMSVLAQAVPVEVDASTHLVAMSGDVVQENHTLHCLIECALHIQTHYAL